MALAAVAASAILFVPSPAVADDGASVRQLETLVVTEEGVIGTGPAGEYRLSRDQLVDFGGASGNLTDALRMIPGVQFSENAAGEERLYELRPSSISISGGRFYENSFLLNGVSFSSGLDPLADNPSNADSVPGHDQALFIDLDMVESITVYESNVPASYGRFTGGVVDVQAKRPAAERGGSWHYSTTRSSWVNYRSFVAQDPDSEDDPDVKQPTGFQRERMGLSYEYPFGDLRTRLSVNRSYAETPTLLLGELRKQQRLNHNLSAALAFPLGSAAADVSLSYAPYESENFLNQVKGSDFSLHGGGAILKAGLEQALSISHRRKLDVGVSFSENRREAADEFFSWAKTPSRFWGAEHDLAGSNEGGFGDLDRRQSGVFLIWKERRAAFDDLAVEYGADLGYQRLEEYRDRDHHHYSEALVNSAIDCRGLAHDCVQHEQYFYERTIRPAGAAEVELVQLSVFGEAERSFGRLSLTFGLRYDHDDFLRNHDIAPRFRGSYDLGGRGTSLIIFGLNRYHGAPLLSYRLREARKPYYSEFRSVTMNIVNDWVLDSDMGPLRYIFTDLRTPYTDEATLGLKQQLYGGVLEFKLVAREGRREFASVTTDTQPDGYRWVMMNNEGASRYRAVSLAWFRKFWRFDLGAHLRWSESRTSNADYDVEVEDASLSGDVFYEGRRVSRASLNVLRDDYNRPLVGGISAAWQISQRWRGSLLANYRGRFKGVVETGRSLPAGLVTLPDGQIVEERLGVYVDSAHPAAVISDLRLAWQWGGRPSLTFEAHVNNLLDARTHTVSEAESGIEVGRNFWLGLKGTF